MSFVVALYLHFHNQTPATRVTSNLADDPRRGRRYVESLTHLVSAPISRRSAQDISHAVITAAMRVHTELGPGLLESTYTACLQYELRAAGYDSLGQVGLPVVNRGNKLDLGYRMDLVVENLVVVEIKSVDAISPVHKAQILSYLKLSGRSLGLLINFNVVHLRDGIKRFVNGTDWKTNPINH